MFKKVIVGISALVLILFVVAAFQPSSYTVERAASIKAPPEKIIPLISDFRQWPQWSPWKNIEAGRMEVLSQTATRIKVKLDFPGEQAKPSLMEFWVEPQADGAAVRWSMSGETDFTGKIMNMIISMDRALGPAFESGLAKMKVAAEK
ncbi:SRPBCC family protein [Duganella sp. sic0402]|uniref:SRPBCC family protein n=1 Tax=Duganella sp. sic0402 TaxID=2854786 RepID=UPI001C496A33|nr:SRPBCC family protein [Duganella sp. sic0402]MBV7535344.1 SRPBCC family protein [Duganella sp. sic0402]